MNFLLTDEQKAFIETARAFSQSELAPYANQWDEQKFFPVETIKKSSDLGFSALYCSEEYGGLGLSRLDSVLIFEELAKGCISSSAYLTVHNMVSWIIDSFAPSDLRRKIMPDMVSMKKLGAYCLTEPSSGSDAASLKTKARLENSEYIIDGSKMFITAGGVADVYVTMARTGKSKTGKEDAKTVSAFLVEKGTKGLSFGQPEKKMGWCSQPTTTVTLDSVAVPVGHLLGHEGEGFKFAMMALDGGRLNIAACALGGASRALDLALMYAAQRKQFGKNLTDFQTIQFKLADMRTELEAARLMVYKAAFMLDQKSTEATMYCAMAKRMATDLCFGIANQALQIHGGYGYIHEYEVERLVRDLRVHQILEGTNEIMRLIIARRMIESM